MDSYYTPQPIINTSPEYSFPYQYELPVASDALDFQYFEPKTISTFTEPVDLLPPLNDGEVIDENPPPPPSVLSSSPSLPKFKTKPLNLNSQKGINQIGYGNMNSQTTVVQNANRRFNSNNGSPNTDDLLPPLTKLTESLNLNQNQNIPTDVGSLEGIGQLRRSNKQSSDDGSGGNKSDEKQTVAASESTAENKNAKGGTGISNFDLQSGLAQTLANMPVLNSLPSLPTERGIPLIS